MERPLLRIGYDMSWAIHLEVKCSLPVKMHVGGCNVCFFRTGDLCNNVHVCMTVCVITNQVHIY